MDQFRRSHHRKRQIAQYLIKEMSISPQLTKILLRLHSASTISQATELFLRDQNGLLQHYFIPDDRGQFIKSFNKSIQKQDSLQNQEKMHSSTEQQKRQKLCMVCDEAEKNHIPCNSYSKFEFQDQSEISQQIKKPQHYCEVCCVQNSQQMMLFIKGVLHNVCLTCTQAYLRQQIGSNQVQHINCPHCGVALNNQIIQEIVDRPTYNKYRIFLRNIQIQNDPNLKWCPNPKCSVVVSTNSKKKTSKCPKCATQICNKCNRQAHPKTDCEGAFQRQIKDWQRASDIQKCKKCQGLVQKIAGCNHMTCSICRYQWCWLCGSQYSSVHFSNINPFGCPGLQDRARDNWSKWKIFLLRAGLLLLFIIGIPALLPVALLLVGPVLVSRLLYDSIYPYGCLKKFGVIILGGILGLISNPFIWLGGIFYFVPKGIMKLVRWCREKAQQNERRANFLRERLLNEQIFEENQ